MQPHDVPIVLQQGCQLLQDTGFRTKVSELRRFITMGQCEGEERRGNKRSSSYGEQGRGVGEWGWRGGDNFVNLITLACKEHLRWVLNPGPKPYPYMWGD